MRLPDIDTGRLSRPHSVPPPLLPFFPLVAPANTLVSLHLQLKVPYISSFHQVLSATLVSTDMSQVGVTLFPSFYYKQSKQLCFCVVSDKLTNIKPKKGYSSCSCESSGGG